MTPKQQQNGILINIANQTYYYILKSRGDLLRIKTNLMTGIIMGAISIAFLFMIPHQIRVPAFDTGAPSPRIIPTFVFTGILICSVILIIQSLFFKKDDVVVWNIKNELPLIIMIAMVCGFAFIIINFGFIAGVCVFFPALLLYMGERKPLTYVITIAVGIGVYLIFTNIFNISLPSLSFFGG